MVPEKRAIELHVDSEPLAAPATCRLVELRRAPVDRAGEGLLLRTVDVALITSTSFASWSNGFAVRGLADLCEYSSYVATMLSSWEGLSLAT